MSVNKPERAKKSITYRRVKPTNDSLSTTCRYCWVIVRPKILRHSSHWTKNYDKCVADAIKHCTGNDEEFRIACETSHGTKGEGTRSSMFKAERYDIK